MPAKSKIQRRAMALPEELYERNKGLKKMSKGQLSEYAKTKEKGLPKRSKKK